MKVRSRSNFGWVDNQTGVKSNQEVISQQKAVIRTLGHTKRHHNECIDDICVFNIAEVQQKISFTALHLLKYTPGAARV